MILPSIIRQSHEFNFSLYPFVVSPIRTIHPNSRTRTCIHTPRIFVNICLRMNSAQTASHKDSQGWEWCPGKREALPKARRDESRDNIIASLSSISGTGGSMTEACIEPGWRINDILLAARVLQNTRPFPSYDNEAEMRRVFGLVYDVLRCKNPVFLPPKGGKLFFLQNISRSCIYIV